MNYQDVRLKEVVEVEGPLDIGQSDDFANVTGVGRVRGIPPGFAYETVLLNKMNYHRSDCFRLARERLRQVDVVGFAREKVLRNMMSYHLDCLRLAWEEGILAPMKQVVVVDFAHVMVLRNMMNCHLDCFRFAREGIHRMIQVDAI